MKTLIIVDAQNDFMPKGALPVPHGNEIIPIINGMIRKFDLVIATQDWHPPKHLSFASNHPGPQPFDKIELNGLEQVLWPDHCVQGTKGAEFHANLETRPIEAIFRKGMDPQIDSYSGFYDNNHEKNTGLAGYLQEKGVKELFVCGLAGDYCVAYTIRDAIKEGFKVTLIEDAVKALDDDVFVGIKEEFIGSGVNIVESKNV